mmetsp:Transcript_43110/g.71665  ORF Transcript_43110/g.71665 Transcript_43110/m.71665 type:complete len:228 (+) Transcript_43110:104-787(+)
MDDEELERIYKWVDEIPLSRPKRNIARDFADGVLMAEIVAHYFPRLVEMHNYPSANSYAQKMYNWNTFNAKVCKKMGFQLSKEELDALVNCQHQAVERTLKNLQQRMAKYGAKRAEAAATANENGSPPAAAQSSAAPSVRATPRVGAATGIPPPTGCRVAAAEARLGQMGVQEGGVQELLAEKDHHIRELRETVDILEIKIQKLEQLVRLKDSKIATLQAKLQNDKH